MSLDHQYQSDVEQDQNSKKNQFYDYQIQNQFNKEKFVNSHDIAGINNLVPAQNEELNIKKIQFRMVNEQYIRKHPELNTLISVFLFKILEEKPENILQYAGKFFDQDQLKEIVEIEKKHYLETHL